MAERVITINIRKYLVTQPRTKRTRKAVKYIRERVAHYTKTPLDSVKLSQDLNVKIFKVYAKTMVPVKVNVKIEKGIATVAPFKLNAEPSKATPEAAKAAQAKPNEKDRKQEAKASDKKAQQPQPKAQEAATKPKAEKQQQQPKPEQKK